MNLVFFKTVVFLTLFLSFIGPLSAQENPVPVKIESPTSSFVSRSFTISGSAQAGAKLHLSINGKTFGRYRADIGGKFTIGVSVPEDDIFIKIDHLVNGDVRSSDSIRLQVGADKTREKIDEPKKEDKKAITPVIEKEEHLPSAKKIPAKPDTRKESYQTRSSKNITNARLESQNRDALKKEAWEKDPVVLNKKQNPNLNQTLAKKEDRESIMGERLAFEALGGIIVTGIMLISAVAIITSDLDPEETLITIFAAELALAPLGVHFGGKLAGGQGDLWAVYVGELFGIAGSVGFLIAGNSIGGSAEDVLFLMAFLSPFIGMITGYEISHSQNAEKFKVFSMQPTLQIEKDVTSLGLRLRF